MRFINGKEYPDNLRGANLRRADLQSADLRDADLTGADLQGADLRRANLRDANLQKASLRDADLRGAYLQGADLRGANLGLASLVRANLHRANLHGTKLHGTVGNGREVISLQTKKYAVTYTGTHLQVGCQYHSITEWMAFDDDTINAMDTDALDWWTHRKRWIQDAIEMDPATSTPMVW
jgi:uncharacterized protein YjbI with pentapeptide repeats